MYGFSMPPSKSSAKRLNAIITGTFEQHLRFLRMDTGMDNNSIARIAIADMAKSRGFIAKPDPTPTKKKPGA